MKVKLNHLSKLLAVAIIGAVSLNSASAAGNYKLQQYVQKKAQSAVKRINHQLPKHAKLNQQQKQRIRGIVSKHQTRLSPLKKDLKQTKRLLRHQNLNKRKNAHQIKQLINKKRNINKRIKNVRQHQQSQIKRVLSKQQRQYLKQRKQTRQQWQQHRNR